MGREIDALAGLDVQNYDEMLAAAVRIEVANPRFKNTEHVLAFLIPGFLRTLSARTPLSYPAEDYAKWIRIISTQYPHPLMLVSIVGFMFKHKKDPTIMLRDSSQMLLDPVWVAEAREEEKRLAKGIKWFGTSEPRLGPRLVAFKPVPDVHSSARSKPAMDQDSIKHLFNKLLAERGHLSAGTWSLFSRR